MLFGLVCQNIFGKDCPLCFLIFFFTLLCICLALLLLRHFRINKFLPLDITVTLLYQTGLQLAMLLLLILKTNKIR
jgi:hypothetical protein